MTRRILVVEDDAETVSYIGKGLREAGFVVDEVASGQDGLRLAASGDYDALVLDRMLPDLDGLTLLTSLRAAGAATPVLFLTAMSAVDERVRKTPGSTLEPAAISSAARSRRRIGC